MQGLDFGPAVVALIRGSRAAAAAVAAAAAAQETARARHLKEHLQAVAIQSRWRGHSLRARMAPFFATWRGWLDAARGEEANIAATVIARQYRDWQVP